MLPLRKIIKLLTLIGYFRAMTFVGSEAVWGNALATGSPGLAKWYRRLATGINPRRGAAFTRAYGDNLANRLPLLYCVVLCNIAVLAASFQGTAPSLLTGPVPLVLACAIGARARHWLPRYVRQRSIEEVERDLGRLSTVGAAAALACTLWALALYPYGTIAQQSLVHYIVAITCFSGILGLGQSPLTALRMAIVTLGPSTAWFLLHAHPNAVPVCSVQVIVSVLLLVITYRYHADFVALERSRQQIVEREGESSRLALRDALTGVPNRRAILSRLEEMLADLTAPSPWLAMVDLDGFKHVNDTFGHPAGDAVLQAVCDRISAIEEVAAFGRLGGDEFAILLPGDLPRTSAHAILGALISAISQPVEYESNGLCVTASVGLRLTERKSINECLERADKALYKAKEIPGRVVEFSAADERAMRERQAITRVFCSANLKDEISIVYQPIVDFDTRRATGYEALARWAPDPSTCIMPATFVSIAERTGRTGDLTAAVLERAIREFLPVHGETNLSVNLSAQDLMREDSAECIARIVAEAGAPPCMLMLEVTETAVMTDMRRAAASLQALRQKGFKIALDDFGAGQSSLSRVHKLPLDHIKIDGSFARDLDGDATGRAVAATILSLARQLKLGCTIEGIETIEQAKVARLLGLRSMQGFLFGRPTAIAATRGSVAA